MAFGLVVEGNDHPAMVVRWAITCDTDSISIITNTDATIDKNFFIKIIIKIYK